MIRLTGLLAVFWLIAFVAIMAVGVTTIEGYL